MKHWVGVVAFLVFGTIGWIRPSQTIDEPQYLSPRPGAQFVSPGTTIALRTGGLVAGDSISDEHFEITGSQSGEHPGHAVLAKDGRTVIFKPDQPFYLGEVVDVTIHKGITQTDGEIFEGKSYRFSVSATQKPLVEPGRPVPGLDIDQEKLAEPNFDLEAALQNVPDYRTVPEDFPAIGIMHPANGTGDGFIFISSFLWVYPPSTEEVVPYLLMLDNSGEPVYYKRLDQSNIVVDFKKQPNGLLTYFDQELGYYLVMDEHYNQVDTYQAGNGYSTDLHELLLLPNGNALLMIYDTQVMDMSKIVTGGNPAAQVIGLIIQELDPSKNVIFEWRSWDHFEITDSSEDLTEPTVDYVHGNAIEVDYDNHLMISSRNMDEVTKINRQTGEIIWRMGGKKNQFTFFNTPVPFYQQHDIRRLPNGNITLFDNRTNHLSIYSRAVEYILNEDLKTATQVWQYRSTPDTYSMAMGNAQRLSNGNTLIGWGTGFPTLTEVKPDGTKAFELTLAKPNVSYRAYRFPWQGTPVNPPDLVVETEGNLRSLYFSWNGATEVASYQIYGGSSADRLQYIGEQAKTGFETTASFVDALNSQCYFQVVAVDSQGNSMKESDVVYSGTPCKHINFIPLINH